MDVREDAQNTLPSGGGHLNSAFQQSFDKHGLRYDGCAANDNSIMIGMVSKNGSEAAKAISSSTFKMASVSQSVQHGMGR